MTTGNIIIRQGRATDAPDLWIYAAKRGGEIPRIVKEGLGLAGDATGKAPYLAHAVIRRLMDEAFEVITDCGISTTPVSSGHATCVVDVDAQWVTFEEGSTEFGLTPRNGSIIGWSFVDFVTKGPERMEEIERMRGRVKAAPAISGTIPTASGTYLRLHGGSGEAKDLYIGPLQYVNTNTVAVSYSLEKNGAAIRLELRDGHIYRDGISYTDWTVFVVSE